MISMVVRKRNNSRAKRLKWRTEKKKGQKYLKFRRDLWLTKYHAKTHRAGNIFELVCRNIFRGKNIGNTKRWLSASERGSEIKIEGVLKVPDLFVPEWNWIEMKWISGSKYWENRPSLQTMFVMFAAIRTFCVWLGKMRQKKKIDSMRAIKTLKLGLWKEGKNTIETMSINAMSFCSCSNN